MPDTRPMDKDQQIFNLSKEIHSLRQQLKHKEMLIQEYNNSLSLHFNKDLKDFTAKAMQGMLSVRSIAEMEVNSLAKNAVYVAKATLQALTEAQNKDGG